jgi:hypothetical protein
MAVHDYDVVIVGASFGGVAAALAAAADAKVRVALLEPSQWIGGQATAQGVTRWDESGMDTIETTGATKSYRDLREAIRAWYRAHTALSAYGDGPYPPLNPGFGKPGYPFAADPSVAHEVLKAQVAALSARLDLRLGTTVVAVQRRNGTVTGLTTAAGDTYTGRFYLDATDLGDLLPLAGIPWTIGAESRADTHELAAPPEAHPEWVQPLTVPVAVERRPANESHLLPEPEGFDDIVRAQRFRVHDGDISGVFNVLPHGEETLFGYRQYVDARNFAASDYAHDRSTLNVGSNDYQHATLPTGDAQRDSEVYQRARAVSLAYVYWLQTQCPRDDGAGHGYPNIALRSDAFGTADGCAPQAYIRESRRIGALTRVVQQDIDAGAFPKGTLRARRFAESCGIGYYGIDVHPSGYGTQWVGLSTLRFQIPLGALLPKQLDNLIASCKNIGTTHITSGAYRVHPVEWAIGEAAGVLAAFCVTQNVMPKDVWAHLDRRASYQYRLLARGVPIYWWSDVRFEDDPRTYAAVHHCGVNGVFSGKGGLAFVPHDRVSPADRQALDQRLGRELPWPPGRMTRGEAAIFICEQMGWPLG